MKKVAVVGAAGYAGIEAVRLVLSHDRLRLTLATSAADQGKQVSSVYPSLAGLTDLSFTLPDPDADRLGRRRGAPGGAAHGSARAGARSCSRGE